MSCNALTVLLMVGIVVVWHLVARCLYRLSEGCWIFDDAEGEFLSHLAAVPVIFICALGATGLYHLAHWAACYLKGLS